MPPTMAKACCRPMTCMHNLVRKLSDVFWDARKGASSCKHRGCLVTVEEDKQKSKVTHRSNEEGKLLILGKEWRPFVKAGPAVRPLRLQQQAKFNNV